MGSSFLIDPPRAMVMPAAWQEGVLILAASISAICVMAALQHLLVKRDPLLFFCLVGGAAAAMLEPITNVFGQAYHPEIGQIVGFNALGREIPLHIALIYPWYFGLFSWTTIRAMDNGMSRAGYWKLFLGTVIFAFGVEIVPVQVGLWKYYGNQPFNIAGMPLWWYVVNPACIVGTAAFACLCIKLRSGWRRWPLVVLIPIGAVGFHTGCSAPLYMAMNSANTVQQNIVPGLISIGFALCLVVALSEALFGDKENSAKA